MVLLSLPMLFACHAFTVVTCQFINSYAGPFEVKLDRLELCPGSSGNPLFNLTQRLTRDRKHTARFFYTGVISHAFDFTNDASVTISLSSWSARGGWKDNAYNHRFDGGCETLKKYATDVNMRRIQAALQQRNWTVRCPFPASKWTFTNFPVDVSTGPFKDFVYGKWRVETKILSGSKPGSEVLFCIRHIVETVPKLRGRDVSTTPPSEANYTGTLQIVPSERLFPKKKL